MNLDNWGLPLQVRSNHPFLDAMTMLKRPWLQAFVDYFPDHFAEAQLSSGYWFYPDGDAPK